MTARGIDAAARIPLVIDYVKLQGRIERLSEREHDAELGNIATSRAVNVATAERRRLHAAIFAGGHAEPAPSPAEVEAERKRVEADMAWLAFYHPRKRQDMDAPARARLELDLESKHGSPDWAVLATPNFPTRDEQIAFYGRVRALMVSPTA